MMKKKLLLMLLPVILLLTAGSAFGKKAAVLEEITRPEAVAADNNQLYITQNSSVYIYSLKDFKLRKKFGTRGQGPQEFIAPLWVIPLKDSILVNSIGKISYYSLGGKFLKEQRATEGFSRMFVPAGKNYVGFSFTQANRANYITVNIYNGKLEKVRELARFKNFLQREGTINPLGLREAVVQVMDGKIFYNSDGHNGIDMYNVEGKKIKTINPGFDRIRLTKQHKKEMHEYLRIDPRFKQAYERMKQRIRFPAYFPVIHQFLTDDKNLYVLTYKQKDGKSEFFVFDKDGKMTKRAMVRFHKMDPHFPSPYTINNGNIYQLVENLEDSEWELHINGI